MKKYYHVLEQSALFNGISPENFGVLFQCLKPNIKQFDKNQTIFYAGDSITQIGLVLEGSVNIVRDDAMGTRTIIANCDISEIFGESFSFTDSDLLSVSVVSTVHSGILFLNSSSILHSCSSSCGFHHLLIKNMVKIISKKNIMLTQKNEILAAKTIRKKIMTYLSILSSQNGSNILLLPYDRQGLADYLSVDRSAMSTELGKLRDEGILKYKKNEFELL